MAYDGLSGLTKTEAARRLSEFGPNALPQASGRRLARIILDTLREPMFLLLIGAAGLYLVLGDLGEGLFLMAGAVATIGLVIFQEARSERALAALRDLSQPHARVIRDGVEARLAARDLVPGDIVLVGEGERLPADGALVAGDVLSVDESALTGESAPVSKRPLTDGEAADADTQPGAETGPYLFSGTLVVRGQAVARIGKTGPRTALGKIGVSLAAIVHEPTPLQKTAGRLVTLLGLAAIAFCGLVTLAYGLLRQDWVGGMLAGITVAIALIPEEFPMSWPSSWRWAPGGWPGKRCWSVAARRLRRWAAPLSSAWIRPAPSPKTGCASRACGRKTATASSSRIQRLAALRRNCWRSPRWPAPSSRSIRWTRPFGRF